MRASTAKSATLFILNIEKSPNILHGFLRGSWVRPTGAHRGTLQLKQAPNRP
jgi:hypothetical protein